MVDARQKGSRTETVIRDLLRKLTGLGWERVPGSGALDPKHMLKADLYVPGRTNIYAVEAKGYKDDHLTSGVITHKSPQLIEFWQQTVRQANQVNKQPLLVFKYDRSKIFVAFEDMPTCDEYRYFFINCDGHQFYCSLLTDWIEYEKPVFVT